MNSITTSKMSNFRWVICALLFIATTVNYMDRQVLSLTWKDFIAPPIWILFCCNHSLLYKSCIAVHQVDDVGMVLGVLVL